MLLFGEEELDFLFSLGSRSELAEEKILWLCEFLLISLWDVLMTSTAVWLVTSHAAGASSPELIWSCGPPLFFLPLSPATPTTTVQYLCKYPALLPNTGRVSYSTLTSSPHVSCIRGELSMNHMVVGSLPGSWPHVKVWQDTAPRTLGGRKGAACPQWISPRELLKHQLLLLLLFSSSNHQRALIPAYWPLSSPLQC